MIKYPDDLHEYLKQTEITHHHAPITNTRLCPQTGIIICRSNHIYTLNGIGIVYIKTTPSSPITNVSEYRNMDNDDCSDVFTDEEYNAEEYNALLETEYFSDTWWDELSYTSDITYITRQDRYRKYLNIESLTTERR